MIILPAVIGAGASHRTIVAANNVKLLLHFDGTDGSTAIIDSSPYNNPLTISGSDTISTAQAKFGTASLLCNGSSYVNAPTTADVSFGAGAFTFEGWFYLGSLSNGFVIWETDKLSFKINGSAIAQISSNFAGGQSGSTTFTTGVWHYFNLSRASTGADIVATIDGTVEISLSGNNDYGTLTQNVIGGSTSGLYSFSNCRLDEVRYTVGSSQSAAVPTAPFT